MPYLILCIGCILFLLSVFGLYSPVISGFDLHAIQILNEHRNKTLNQIVITLAYLGGMPFVLFFTMVWCLVCAWYKKYSTLIFILIGVSGSIVLGWLLKWCFNLPDRQKSISWWSTMAHHFPVLIVPTRLLLPV